MQKSPWFLCVFIILPAIQFADVANELLSRERGETKKPFIIKKQSLHLHRGCWKPAITLGKNQGQSQDLNMGWAVQDDNNHT
jgi:hypothetical protein